MVTGVTMQEYEGWLNYAINGSRVSVRILEGGKYLLPLSSSYAYANNLLIIKQNIWAPNVAIWNANNTDVAVSSWIPPQAVVNPHLKDKS